MTLNITAVWDAFGWAILHSLWQGALIACLVWVARALATDRHAWLRYLAGMGGLVATFAAFIATFIILIFERAHNTPLVEFATSTGASAPADLTLSMTVLPAQLANMGLAEALVPWLGMIWAVGFAILSLQAYRAYATTRWLATQGLRSPGKDWTSRFAVLIKRSRTHARVRLFVSEHVQNPMTLGALRPIVLVPVGFLTALPPAQIEAILLHELGHIRRHDFLFGLIQTAIRTALYFNPAVIMMSRQIDEDREKACDDIAVSISGNARDLVRGLAALRLNHHAPAMVMSADGGPLLTRLNRLMGRPASHRASSRLTAAAVSALLLGTAACSTVSMANPNPPVAPETSEPPATMIPDTVIRANTEGQPNAFMSKTASLPPIPAMPPMPAMPELPETPALPALPALPIPIFANYDSKDGFEAAMEKWGQSMEVWGEEVERRFEGDWEDRMDVWGEEMGAWGEAIEQLSQNFGEQSFDDSKIEDKADAIRARIMRKVEARRLADNEARHDTLSSRPRNPTITLSADNPYDRIVINGQPLEVNAFRTQVMTALVKDGFVRTRDQSVKLKLCEGDVIVNGKTSSKAQAKRYTQIVGGAGFILDDTLVFKFKPDLLTVTMTEPGQKIAKQISIGTFDHTSNK